MTARRLPVVTLALLTALLSTLVAAPVTAPDAADEERERPETTVTATERRRAVAAVQAQRTLQREIEEAARRATAPPTAPLTGVEVPGERLAELGRRPAAVVKVPNDEPSHPHTGLESADLVVEQETEGGTTRFAAVFHSEVPEVVGNIRSARFVDVPLVAPLDAVFVYAGARGEVLERIEEADLVSVGAGGPGYFTRPERTAPHHLYSRLAEAMAERPRAPPAPRLPWAFDERPPDGGHDLGAPVRVLMSPIAATGWDYDPEEGLFRRLQNDRPHRVTGPGRIGAANVVLLDVRVRARDSRGAPVYELEGAGDALLLRDGRALEVRWAKAGLREHLELLDGRHPARLKPGPTWLLLTYDGVVDDVLASIVERRP